MDPLLEINNFSRSYGYRRALDSISFELNIGETLLIQGPNGAGKSTLLGAIISRNAPESGSLRYRSQTITSEVQRRKFLSRLAYLGHEPGLLYDLSAIENLRFFYGLFYKRIDENQRNKIIEESLERCSLAHRANDTVRSFSRGMKQRLGMARLLLHDPELLLLDEPLTGLDRQGEELLVQILSSRRQRGGAALIVTHSDELFREMTDRFLFLFDGKLVADIPSERYTPEAHDRLSKMLYPKK